MSISSANLGASFLLQQSIQRIQSELATRQTELSTGKVADAGLSLGGRTQQLVSFQQQDTLLSAFQDTNGLLTTRLDQTQAALSGLSTTVSDLRTAALSVTAGESLTGLMTQASASLQSAVSGLNTSVNGEYVFGGINSGQAPMADYYGQPGLARQAVAAAFQTAFGTSQSGLTVGSISPAQMTAFLNGPFAALFSDPQWNALWSSASNTNPTIQVAPGQDMPVNGNANDPAARNAMMAMTMLADLGIDKMDPATAQVVIQKAAQVGSSTVSNIGDTQADLGLAQNRVTAASQQMTATRNALTTAADKLDGADPYQTALRINELQTQLESSYQLTAQLQQLSLAKFL